MGKNKCYACGKTGHYANKCLVREQKKDENENEEQDVEERHSHLKWNASTFHTKQVNKVQQSVFGPKDVFLDNQATISVVRPELLCDVQDAEEVVKINGVGGHQFTVMQTGYLDPLFCVYASEDTHANILSLSEEEDQYTVAYIPQNVLWYTYLVIIWSFLYVKLVCMRQSGISTGTQEHRVCI